MVTLDVRQELRQVLGYVCVAQAKEWQIAQSKFKDNIERWRILGHLLEQYGTKTWHLVLFAAEMDGNSHEKRRRRLTITARDVWT